MNRSTEILDYLSGQAESCELVVAPNAPPVTRDAAGRLCVALSLILDSADVADTLMSLRGRASQMGIGGLPASGEFSFGVKDVGRFRVAYVTQRGSKALRIARMPFRVPDMAEITDDMKTMRRLRDLLLAGRHGVIAIGGTSAMANSRLVHSILQSANEHLRAVVCTVERALTFLLTHHNSLIVQTDLLDDVTTFEEGLRGMLLLEPDIVLIADLWPSDHVPSLARLADSRKLVILTSSALGGEELLRHFMPRSEAAAQLNPSMIWEAVDVIPLPNGRAIVRTDQSASRI